MARTGVTLRCRRVAAIAALAMLLVAEGARPVSAQNLFEALFDGFRQAMTPRAPARVATGSEARHGGLSSGYCVRLCDGRYFPVAGRGKMNAAEMCNAFCPATPTQLFSGGGMIDRAVSPTGQRYGDLPNAFVFRNKIVADCSCNGKGPLGLMRFEAEDDPTLRTGDIVATHDGLMTYRNDGRHAGFVPFNNTPGLSAQLKERLNATRVEPDHSTAAAQTGTP